MQLLRKITGFLRREAMLSVAALCALASMLAVPPSAAYLDYIDLRVLCLLFCLMAVVAGFQACGLFALLSRKILQGGKRAWMIALALVLLPFFSSMLVTNDVALLTFVPFAISVLRASGQARSTPLVVTLQTVAANLGSMATPVGNPQNLFLYNYYALPAGAFFAAVLPIAGVSLIALAAASLFSMRGHIHVEPETGAARLPGRFWLYAGLFVLCLFSVFRLLDYRILTAVVILCLLVFSRKLLLRVDYCLLLTFVCFFIFAGNIGALPALREFLTGALEKNTLLSSALASQVVSNVPAAVLLSGFTENWRGLLLGVDVGGLGTPIASLASLISLKLYSKSPGARPWLYLGIFTLANVIGLALLLPLAALI